MDLSTLYGFYTHLQDDNLSLAYQGEFNDDMTEKLISLSEYHIENVDELKKSKKKISFLIAESFQNIVRHGDKVNTDIFDNKVGVFFTRNIGNTYYITSANIIENENIEMLRSTIEKVNSLGAEDLKTLYMNVLANEGLSSKGGAGLGLIEMARKSGHRLDYEFEKINDKYSHFYLQVKLNSSPDTSDQDHKQTLSTIKGLRKTINDENILLIYKGDFSEDSIMPVLKMIKDNMEKKDEGFIIRKRVYMVLVEMLQNISKHSLSQNGMQSGIMMIGKKENRYIINTGNLIETHTSEILKGNLNKINIATRDELSEMHTKTLVEGSISEKGGAGLGLMDIAKKSCDKLKFTIVPMPGNVSFFGLNTQI